MSVHDFFVNAILIVGGLALIIFCAWLAEKINKK